MAQKTQTDNNSLVLICKEIGKKNVTATRRGCCYITMWWWQRWRYLTQDYPLSNPQLESQALAWTPTALEAMTKVPKNNKNQQKLKSKQSFSAQLKYVNQEQNIFIYTSMISEVLSTKHTT